MLKSRDFVFMTIILVLLFTMLITRSIPGNDNIAIVLNQQVENIKEINKMVSNRIEIDRIVYDAKRMEALKEIGNQYGYDDIGFLAYIIGVEKQLHLQKCELLALVSVETRFNNSTVRDCNDGNINYGPAQIRPPVARVGYHINVSRGYSMPSVSDCSLRDREYNVRVAGGYLAYLHQSYLDNHEVWTAYNRSEGNMGIYREKYGHAETSYSKEVNKRMLLFRSIIDGYY